MQCPRTLHFGEVVSLSLYVGQRCPKNKCSDVAVPNEKKVESKYANSLKWQKVCVMRQCIGASTHSVTRELHINLFKKEIILGRSHAHTVKIILRLHKQARRKKKKNIHSNPKTWYLFLKHFGQKKGRRNYALSTDTDNTGDIGMLKPANRLRKKEEIVA